MKNSKKKKGFTIVELVIVIAVIGVLSAILIPTFSGLIEKAKKSSEQLSLRNSYAAYATAAMDDAEKESAVYLSKASSLEANSVVFYLDAADGEWKKVTTPLTVANYELVEVEVEGEASPVSYFGGYYVYVAA